MKKGERFQGGKHAREASQTLSEEISLAAFRELTLEQQGPYLITFGKAHRGQSYADIWEKEPGYVKWFQATYHASKKPEHQRFLHYVTRQVEHFEETAPSHQVTSTPAPKSKAYPKPKPATAQMPVTAQDLVDISAEESWEVIQQEGQHCVRRNHMGNLIKISPEHIREISEQEKEQIPQNLHPIQDLESEQPTKSNKRLYSRDYRSA